jgi:hypothetical protein
MQVADAVAAPVGGRRPVWPFTLRPAGAMARPNRQRAKLVEGETPIRELRGHFFDAIQLGLLSGSVESFQVRVRWNEILSLRRICRSRSRPICTRRAGSPAR